MSIYAQQGPRPIIGKCLSSEDLKRIRPFDKKEWPESNQLVVVPCGQNLVYGQVIITDKESGEIAVCTTTDLQQTCIGLIYKKEQLKKLSS